MEISRDAYRALEDILGPEYITDDPAFLDSYAFEWLAELVRPNRSHYMPRPWAVAMPDTTAEVQAVTMASAPVDAASSNRSLAVQLEKSG